MKHGSLPVLGIATILVLALPARAERCLEFEGVCRELLPSVEGILGVWNFKASVGKGGFAYVVQAHGESTPRHVLGGEDGFVAVVTRPVPSDPALKGYISQADAVPVTGLGPGGLLYALVGNYSGRFKPDTQLPLVSMLAQYPSVPETGVRQAWQFDPGHPFGAHAMSAYVLPGPAMPKDPLTDLYPDGWKIGEMKVLQRDSRWGIPTLVEATWSVPRRSATRPQARDEVDAWVVVRLEVSRVSEGERSTYLPELERPLLVEDQRARLPNGEYSRYYLRPGDRWPGSDSADFTRRQREALALLKSEQQVQRKPMLAAATTLAGAGIFLALVSRFTRPAKPKTINIPNPRNAV